MEDATGWDEPTEPQFLVPQSLNVDQAWEEESRHKQGCEREMRDFFSALIPHVLEHTGGQKDEAKGANLVHVDRSTHRVALIWCQPL